MKSNIFFVILLCILFVIGCNGTKEKTAGELLENSTMEDEIYSSILNDSVHFSKFINKMAMDERGKKMMAKNSSMVKVMCMSEKVDSLMSNDKQVMESLSNRLIKRMEADSFVCDVTCTRMMESEYLKKYFREHGISK
jgi:hypothetical protein